MGSVCVSDLVLTAISPLAGVDLEFDGVTITEITGRAIVAISPPAGGDQAMAEGLAASYQISLPAVGETTASPNGAFRLLGLQTDQFFLLFECDQPNAVEQVAEKLGNNAYLTDQSDSWAMIAVSGSKIMAVMERICPIDLDGKNFPAGRVARTVMEHLSVIVLRERPDRFALLSPRSSAASFLHMLETTARNVA
jgi:sarcosine oxidase subunit gamma